MVGLSAQAAVRKALTASNRRSRPPPGITAVGLERGAPVAPVRTTSSSRSPPSARMT